VKKLRISVCIPARNEATTLPLLLASLANQTLPPDEVILADGGSVDNTVAVARACTTPRIRIVECGPAFPGRARNLAIAAAANSQVALIDAGCVARSDWLEQLAATQARTGAPVVFGNYHPTIRSSWDLAQALSMVPAPDPTTGCRPPFIASSLLLREVWRAVGGFPEHLRAAEDLLFFERLSALGVKIARCPAAIIEWSLPRTPSATLRRLKTYSAYHLAAGLGRTWHLRVMGMDTVALLLTVMAFWWPLATTPVLAGFLLRVLRSVEDRRAVLEGRSLGFATLARTAWVLLLADVATWGGAANYLLSNGNLRSHPD
jgi:glycosyltransferase involved in cell wall biosynthesis